MDPKKKAAAGKPPAFQWYPGDHRRDTGVQACSFEARALWREMMDLMHDGEPRGHLTAGGMPIGPEALARMVGITPAQAKRWLRELEDRKVFSRTSDGVIHSRRMVRDEHISQVRRDAGKLGGNPDLFKQTDNQNGNNPPTKDEANDNQREQQKPTPAVAICDLRSAVASFSLDLDPESSNKRSEKAAIAVAPLADARIAALLEPVWEAFARRFYATADGKRLGEVARQILATLSDGGAHLGKKHFVRAFTVERLIGKMRETIDSHVKDPDKAIRVLLLKLGDTSDGSAPGAIAAAEQQHETQRDDAAIAHELVDANVWLDDHADVDTLIEQQLERDGFHADSDVYVLAQAYRVARNQLVLDAFRRARPPSHGHGGPSQDKRP